MNNVISVKYWSWFGAFAVSSLVWAQLLWVILR
ncbi:small membrane protein YmiC [Siccibacter colletis]|nr:small membrane protein YmiC [Siccibacter colletis]WNN46920.1 small membrane protein YmiC [Siccibacter colletis]